MTSLLEKIRQLIKKQKTELEEQQMVKSAQNAPHSAGDQKNKPGDAETLNAAIVTNLMEMLDHTQEGMFSCEETFALLDEYVELVADDEEAAALMPYVKRHLDKCPECTNVYETLLTIIQSEPPAVEPSS